MNFRLTLAVDPESQRAYRASMSSTSVNVNRVFLFFAGFALGVISGLRSMTALAVVAWGARIGWLDLQSTWLAFLSRVWFVYTITALAVGELIADKLPSIPDRTSPAPLFFRFITGGLAGAAVFVSAHQPLALGLFLGVLGALAGAFEGHRLRRRLTKERGFPDFPIALIEDIAAVGGALLLVSHLY